jgi:hypothetical protein
MLLLAVWVLTGGILSLSVLYIALGAGVILVLTLR